MIWSILDGALVAVAALGLVAWQLVSLAREKKRDAGSDPLTRMRRRPDPASPDRSLAAPPRDPVGEHPLDDG